MERAQLPWLERKDFSDQPLFEAELAKTDYQTADYIPAEYLHLCQGYELVMLSSVLNIQETEADLSATLNEAYRLLDRGGKLLVNYPKSPRRLNLSLEEAREKVEAAFGSQTKLHLPYTMEVTKP